MADETVATSRPRTGSLLHLRSDRRAGHAGGDGNACHQHPAAVAAADGGVLKVSTASVTSAITVFLAVFAVGQLVVGPVRTATAGAGRY